MGPVDGIGDDYNPKRTRKRYGEKFREDMTLEGQVSNIFSRLKEFVKKH